MPYRNMDYREYAIFVQTFDFFQRSREQCYNIEDDFIQLRSAKGGGVGIFVRESENAQMLTFPVSNMEGLVLRLVDVILIVLYRPPSYPMHFFLEKLKLLMTSTAVQNEANVYVVGDFNENVATAWTNRTRNDKTRFLTKSLSAQYRRRNNNWPCICEKKTKGSIADHCQHTSAIIRQSLYQNPKI